jgi:hypothetical protein
MSTYDDMKDRLEVEDGELYWKARGGMPQSLAGNKRGKGPNVRFNCKLYDKKSVMRALAFEDETLLKLIPTESKAPKAPKAPEIAAELRELLTTASNREDLLAIYRTIELLESLRSSPNN